MSRFSVLLIAVVLLLIAAAPAGADDGPIATAAKSCSVGDSRSYGTTYVLWIRARHASCRRARKVVRGFHKCREGARGRCGGFNGWNCSENRDFGRGSFYSTVKCKKGGKTVRHKYNQWT